MAAVAGSFRPAGVSDDDYSDEDDFIIDYKAKKPFSRNTDLGKVTGGNGRDGDKENTNLRIDNHSQDAGHLQHVQGQNALPLNDFRHATIRGDLEATKRCLGQGIPVDSLLTTGWTALMYTGNNAKQDVMKYLIEKGANVNFHCNHYSVLMATCGSTKNSEENVLACVQVLIENRVDVNAFDRHHMSALMYASRGGRPKVVQKLLDSGANMEKQDSKGYTALHWACCKGHVLVAQVLIERGADVHKKTSDGSLPSDIAFVNGKERICTMLQSTSNGHDNPVAAMGCAGDAITQNCNETCNGSPSEEEKTNPLLHVVGSSSQVCTYGDLEVYLSGLQLSQYIETFQRNQVTFQAFLRMTDHDLQQLGIHQMGHRKKILDSIHATHKRDWESSSLHSIQYNKQLKCSEALATLSNINKHTSYISSTVGYIMDQIKAHPEILRSGQDGSSVEDLVAKTKEGATNIRNLYLELTDLQSHLNKISGAENLDPPDLIRRGTNDSCSVIRPQNILLSVMGISIVVMLYRNRVSILGSFS